MTFFRVVGLAIVLACFDTASSFGQTNPPVINQVQVVADPTTPNLWILSGQVEGFDPADPSVCFTISNYDNSTQPTAMKGYFETDLAQDGTFSFTLALEQVYFPQGPATVSVVCWTTTNIASEPVSDQFYLSPDGTVQPQPVSSSAASRSSTKKRKVASPSAPVAIGKATPAATGKATTKKSNRQASTLSPHNLSAAGHTKPSGPTGGKPTGKPTNIPAKESPENKQALTRENESAVTLANGGYVTQQNPPPAPGSPKNPDYLIEGQYFDNYAPTSSNPDNIAERIGEKAGKGQATRVILNLDDSNVDTGALTTSINNLNNTPGNGMTKIQEIIIIKGGVIKPFYSK